MKWLTRVSALVLIVLLSGCYAANVLEMDGLKPSEVMISPSVKSLTVVSRSDLDSIFKAQLVTSGQADAFKRDSTLAKLVVLGCSDALLESPRFDLFNPVLNRKLSIDYSDPPRKLPWTMVQEVSGIPPHDAVLSLEKGDVDDKIKANVPDLYFTNYQYLVFIKTFWRLYRLSDFQSKEFIFIDTISFDIENPAEFSSSPDLKLAYISQAMYEAGGMSARRLAPWWDSFTRYYFAFGPANFLSAAVYLKEGKFLEAAEIWRPYTELKNKMMASKACYNMALTCEMANSFPAALEWLKKSEMLGMREFYIIDYRAKLLVRKAEADKLDSQMR